MERKGRGRTAEGSWYWKPSASKRIFPKGIKVRGQGGKMAGEPRSQSESPPGQAAVSGRSRRAAVFAGWVDTLGLLIRVMKLGVGNSVPRPSKHTSELTPKLSLWWCRGPSGHRLSPNSATCEGGRGRGAQPGPCPS